VDVLAWVKTFLAAFKPSVKTMVCVFVLSVAALLWPSRWIAYVPIHAAVNAHIVWVVGLALFSGVWLLWTGAEAAWKRINRFVQSKRRKSEMGRYLEEMPIDQLNILFKYSQAQVSTLKFDPANGAVRDLERRGFIYQSSELGSMTRGFSYTITKGAS
jgi:Super-infection exclusion protein B